MPRRLGQVRRNWLTTYRDEGLVARPRPEAEPSKRRERSVHSWLAKSPEAFGYKTSLRAARRRAKIFEK